MKAQANPSEQRFNRLLWRTAVLPILLMLAASFLLARLVASLLDDAKWVDHTDQVIAQARRCKESGLSIERSLRGFQITGTPDYAGTFASYSNQLPAELKRLREIVADNASQVRNVEQIQTQVSHWLEASKLSFDRLRQNQNGNTREPEKGREYFDQFLAGLDDFISTEEGLREKRSQALSRLDRNIRTWRTAGLVLAGGLLSFLLAHEVKALATTYRASEQAAHARAKTLETTLASIADGVIATDDHGKITFFNSVAEQLTGWTSEQARNRALKEVFDCVSEKTGQRIEDPGREVFESSAAVVRPEHGVLRAKGGRTIAVEERGSPIRDPSGKTWGMVLVFRDRTKDQAAQRKLGHLAAIVRSSDDAIISKDLKGRITSWNRGAERLFGYSEGEALDRSITMLIPPDHLHEEERIMGTINRGERVEHFETVRLTKGGRPLDVSVAVSPIFDEQGKVMGASNVARDISKQKADAEMLRRARDELEQRVAERTAELTSANQKLIDADRFKSDFLAAMSHELRTPLNSIIGFTEIIKSGRAGPVTGKQIEYLGMAHGSARHLLTLINDLLDLSRIEAGKDELYLEDFEVAPVIEEAIGNVQNAANVKGLRIESATIAGQICSDRKKLYQIVLNLLNNAVKFTDRGKVTIQAERNDGELTVTVEDTGIGMTEEQLQFVFEAFRRAEQPAKRIYEGTGLGLYLCKKLVALLGGEIWVASRLGEGSRFAFKIPATPE